MNKVMLIGRLVSDPQSYTYGDKTKALLSLAVQRPHNRDTVDYIDCVAWAGLAQIIIKHCRKGDKIAIEGAIRQDKYLAQDGQKRTKYVVNIEKMEFCGHKMHQNAPNNTFSAISQEEIDDKLPWEV